MCVRVSEDSIWTVPSLPVGKGTTWLYAHHSLTSDLSGSHMRKPRYLHIRRYASTVSRPAVLRDWCSYTETERRNEWGSAGRTGLFSQAARVSLEFTRTFLNPCVTQQGKQHTEPPHTIPNMSSGSGSVTSEERKTRFWLSGHKERQSKQYNNPRNQMCVQYTCQGWRLYIYNTHFTCISEDTISSSVSLATAEVCSNVFSTIFPTNSQKETKVFSSPHICISEFVSFSMCKLLCAKVLNMRFTQNPFKNS